MCTIFPKKSKIFEGLGKNIQNFKIFWKRACFLSHLYLKTLKRLLPCFLISSAFVISFSSFLPSKQFKTEIVWNFELCHVLMPLKIIHVASDFQQKDWAVHFLSTIFTIRKHYIPKFSHYQYHQINYPQQTKRTISLQKDVSIVQNYSKNLELIKVNIFHSFY